MTTDLLERPNVSRKLTLAEFQTQLWIGLISDKGDLLPRYEIAWGQPSIDMDVPRDDATYTDFRIYDRPVGGEHLLFGFITPAVRSHPTINVTIRLACEFWP